MSIHSVFDSSIHLLDQVLDLRSRKLEVISANIANAETPGYSRVEMDFETALARASGNSTESQSVTHPRHMRADFGDQSGPGGSAVSRRVNQSPIGDGNNVVLEKEMVDLSENQIRYEAAIQMLNKKFNMLKMVIQERA